MNATLHYDLPSDERVSLIKFINANNIIKLEILLAKRRDKNYGLQNKVVD